MISRYGGLRPFSMSVDSLSFETRRQNLLFDSTAMRLIGYGEPSPKKARLARCVTASELFVIGIDLHHRSSTGLMMNLCKDCDDVKQTQKYVESSNCLKTSRLSINQLHNIELFTRLCGGGALFNHREGIVRGWNGDKPWIIIYKYTLAEVIKYL
jgi:hypothetical protein